QIKRPDRRISSTGVGLRQSRVEGRAPVDGERARTAAALPSPVRFDFSYSGIKTAVLRYVETHDMAKAIERRRRALGAIAKPELDDYLAQCDKQTLNLVASFQRAMVDDLVEKTLAAAREFDVATLFVTGGVAANAELRETFESEAAEQGLPV